MGIAGWIVFGVVAWLVLAMVVAGCLGQVVRERDEQRPRGGVE